MTGQLTIGAPKSWDAWRADVRGAMASWENGRAEILRRLASDVESMRLSALAEAIVRGIEVEQLIELVCREGVMPLSAWAAGTDVVRRLTIRLAVLLATGRMYETDEQDHGPGCDGPLNCTCKIEATVR